MHRDNLVKTQGRDSHLQTKERALRENQTFWNLNLWPERKWISGGEAPQFVELFYGSLANQASIRFF